MGAGDIVVEANQIVQEMTVKTNEDIELGEVVYNDGNGILAAPAGAKGPFFMAMEAHIYADESTHKIRCLVRGTGDMQKVAGVGSGAAMGQFVELSSTDGEVQKWDYTTPGDWFDVVGTLHEVAGDSDTTAKVRIGKE